jgi:hypothetical protein
MSPLKEFAMTRSVAVQMLLCSAICLIGPAHGIAADADLAARVTRLEAAIDELRAENRELRGKISQLETLQRGRAEPGPAMRSGTGPAEGKANWRRLKRGMTADQVESVLGPPTKVEAGSLITYWSYSTTGILGPHVRFDSRSMTVDGWKEP